MTTTIEPTQEQRDAARDWLRSTFASGEEAVAPLLARFLAEREAKLRAEVMSLRAWSAADSEFQQGQQRTIEDLKTALDTLTKRNATLLADKDDLIRQLRRVEEDRDAAHAEIAALKAKLAEAEALLREVLEQLHERPQPFVDGIVHTTGVDALGVVDRARAALTLPAGAGTEWAAPIAVADGTALRLVGQWPGNESDETIAALLADEKGGAK